ncbi:MAG: hypothetical protein ACXWQ5_00985 [Ktedonobacterales bacterium]
MRKMYGVLVFLLVAIWCVAALATLTPKTPVQKTSSHYCVLVRTPETDGVPVRCLNTGKLATNADLAHVCFTDGLGIELYNVTDGKFEKTSCDATIPTLPAYAQYWASVVFTTDNQIATVAAWNGDNYVIVSGETANTHAGTDANIVAYLKNIQAEWMHANLADQ